jgi:hypothetical protein
MVANKSFGNNKSLANDSNKSRQIYEEVQNMIAYIHFYSAVNMLWCSEYGVL